MQNRSDLAIATSDWHIMAEKPRYRKTGFVGQQYNKIKFILDYASDQGMDIYLAGDVYDRARVPRWLSSKYLHLFSQYHSDRFSIYACAGQHDQIFHSQDIRDTSIQEMFAAGFFERGGGGIQTADWGTDFSNKKDTVIAHVCCTEKPIDFISYAIPAKKLLKLTRAKLIVTGDYHKAHSYSQDGRLVVNPGSIMRLSSDSMKKKPSFYVIDTLLNEVVDQVFLPVEPAAEVFDIGGIEKHKEDKRKSQELSSRFDSYLDKVKQETIKPDFYKVLSNLIAEDKPSEAVKLEIDDIMETVKS